MSDLSAAQREMLARFASRVSSSPHNLLSRAARAQVWERHIPECLALARLLPYTAGPPAAETQRQRLLDVGSGGGFPGMVVAIARPDLAVTLVESTGKKARFLAETANALGLDVVVVEQRAESLTQGAMAGTFDLVTARAVAPLERLLAWTVPFLAPTGLLYALKGERWPQELAAAATSLRRAGARVVATPADLVAPGSGEVGPDATPRVVIIGRAS